MVPRSRRSSSRGYGLLVAVGTRVGKTGVGTGVGVAGVWARVGVVRVDPGVGVIGVCVGVTGVFVNVTGVCVVGKISPGREVAVGIIIKIGTYFVAVKEAGNVRVGVAVLRWYVSKDVGAPESVVDLEEVETGPGKISKMDSIELLSGSEKACQSIIANDRANTIARANFTLKGYSRKLRNTVFHFASPFRSPLIPSGRGAFRFPLKTSQSG
jgi:hypothetical protein